MKKPNDVLLQDIQDQLLGKYFLLLDLQSELDSVLHDLSEVKETIKPQYDLIEQRRDLREEEMQTIINLLNSIGYDTKLLP